MDAELDSDAPQPEISAHVASCVIRVGELDRSLKLRRGAASTRRGPVLAVGHRNTESDLQELRSGLRAYDPGSSPTPKTE